MTLHQRVGRGRSENGNPLCYMDILDKDDVVGRGPPVSTRMLPIILSISPLCWLWRFNTSFSYKGWSCRLYLLIVWRVYHEPDIAMILRGSSAGRA